MKADNSRSDQVIEAYKRHKLSVSALHHIRRMLREFDRERAADRKLAIVGVVVIVSLFAVMVWLWLGGNDVVIS